MAFNSVASLEHGYERVLQIFTTNAEQRGGVAGIHDQNSCCGVTCNTACSEHSGMMLDHEFFRQLSLFYKFSLCCFLIKPSDRFPSLLSSVIQYMRFWIGVVYNGYSWCLEHFFSTNYPCLYYISIFFLSTLVLKRKSGVVKWGLFGVTSFPSPCKRKTIVGNIFSQMFRTCIQLYFFFSFHLALGIFFLVAPAPSAASSYWMHLLDALMY